MKYFTVTVCIFGGNWNNPPVRFINVKTSKVGLEQIGKNWWGGGGDY